MNKIELSKVIANDIFAEIPIDCDKSEIGDVLDEMKTIIYSHLSKANTINEEELNRLAKQEMIRLVSYNGLNLLSQRNKDHADLHNVYDLMRKMYKDGYRKAKEEE